MDQAETLYQQGSKAIQHQNLSEGQRLLRESLSLNPRNDKAWMLLSQTTDDPARKLKCIENALKANPQNSQAIQLKQQLVKQSKGASPVIEQGTAQTDGDITLGRLLLKVGPRKWLQIKRVLFFIALAAVSLIFTYSGSITTAPDGKLFWFAFAGILGASALLTLGLLIYNLNQVIGVYDKGIVLIRWGKERVYRWTEFDALTTQDQSMTYRYFRIPLFTYTQYHVKLLRASKTILNLSNEFEQFRQLGDLAMRLTTPIMTQQALQNLKAGKTLEFGALKADRNGVKRGNKLVAWRDLTEWQTNNGWLNIYSGDTQAFRHNVSKMQNPHVFMSLLDQLSRRGL